MEFARALDFEDADVGPLADDPPEMKPLALTLQLGRAFALEDARPLDLFRIRSVQRLDGDEDVKQQGLTP
jgi:hypothetical protein